VQSKIQDMHIKKSSSNLAFWLIRLPTKKISDTLFMQLQGLVFSIRNSGKKIIFFLKILLFIDLIFKSTAAH
jgi:hypothetical protein